jgi:hypothetical protein
LPGGYVAVASTSDPNFFILAPTVDAQGPYGLSARNPFRAYLWDLRSGRLKLVASSLGWIETSPDSLAYLNVVSDAVSTLSLAADGSTTPVALPRAASISPDGTHDIWTSDPTSAGVVTIELRVTARAGSWTHLWERTRPSFGRQRGGAGLGVGPGRPRRNDRDEGASALRLT